jgi:ubiquinone/menaquinone biosynthesis C-methylase UbiE
MKSTKESVCPVEKAGLLDNGIRKIFQNPGKILKPYIKEKMVVLDLGCGPGFFSMEIGKLLNNSGTVICADLQDGMLDVVRRKIKGLDNETIFRLHKCESDSINLDASVDFVLAFYMIHEVPNQRRLFDELKSILNPGGQILIIEPKFHVTKNAFASMVENLVSTGFEVQEMPRDILNRSILVKKK